MTMPQAPAPGSKPAPCTPEQSRALAKKKADETEMPFHRFHSMARAVGVTEIRTIDSKGGIAIVLSGNYRGRNVSANVHCPAGHPLLLYMARALEEFKRGMGVPTEAYDAKLDDLHIPTHLDGRVPQGETTPEQRKKFDDAVDAHLGIKHATEAEPDPGNVSRSSLPSRELSPEEFAAQFANFDPADASREHLEHIARMFKMATAQIAAPAQPVVQAPMPASPNPAAPPSRAQLAADIAQRSVAVDINKPHAAGEGKRRPLGLPLCKQCKTQPVYVAGAEFCGGACGRQWHIDKQLKGKGIKLP